MNNPQEVKSDTFEEENDITTGLGVPAQNLSPNTLIHSSTEITATPIEDLDDLPDDVKKNLKGWDNMELDEKLIKVMGSYNHSIDVDKIIISLWKLYRKTPERNKVQGRLREMCKNGIVKRLDRGRGEFELVNKAYVVPSE